MGLGNKGILGLIGMKAMEGSLKNVKTIQDIIKTKNPTTGKLFAECITPGGMLNGTVAYLYSEACENDDTFEDFSSKIQKMVMSKQDLMQVLHDEDIQIQDLGLALICIGSKLMDLEHFETEVVEEKMANKTLTEEDLNMLASANVKGLDDDMMDKLDEYFGYEDDADGNETCGGDCAGCSCGGHIGPNTKVVDINGLYELIKTDSVGVNVLSALVASKGIDLADLMKAVGPVKFAEVMTKIADFEKDKPDSKLFGADSSAIKQMESMKKKLDVDKEVIIKSVMAQTDVPFDEKIIRQGVLAGVLSDEDILFAIKNSHLNPYFLEGAMRDKDPARFAILTREIIRQNAPELMKQMEDKGNPLNAIMNIINKKK